MKEHKLKLTIEEQIADLKSKGIKFNIVDEESAKRFLTNNTYYFKIKAYERDFDKYQRTDKAGQFINLDFAYLKELSTIDMHFRKLIIELALDVEHALKVQLLNDLNHNDAEDGYSIVRLYFELDYKRLDRVNEKAGKSFISDLVKKHADDDKEYSLWEIVEIISFGDFADLYELYYQRYPSKHDYSSFLWSIKFIRNAAAHNNCLLNSIKAPYSRKFEVTKELLSQIKGDVKTKERWLSNPVIHDFLALVYVFLSVVKSERRKSEGISKMKNLIDHRMIEHKDYFEKNDTLMNSYVFVQKTVSFLCNKLR